MSWGGSGVKIVVDRWAVAHGRLWCLGGLRGLCVVGFVCCGAMMAALI